MPFIIKIITFATEGFGLNLNNILTDLLNQVNFFGAYTLVDLQEKLQFFFAFYLFGYLRKSTSLACQSIFTLVQEN